LALAAIIAISALVGWRLAIRTAPVNPMPTGIRSEHAGDALIRNWRTGVAARAVHVAMREPVTPLAKIVSCCGIRRASIRITVVKPRAFEVAGTSQHPTYLALLTKVRGLHRVALLLVLRRGRRLLVVISRNSHGALSAWVDPRLLQGR
jgi:hypothetical protein